MPAASISLATALQFHTLLTHHAHSLSRESTLQQSPTLALVPSLKRAGHLAKPALRLIARPEDRGIEVPEVVVVEEVVVTNPSLQIAATICPVVVKGHRRHLVEGLAGLFVSAAD